MVHGIGPLMEITGILICHVLPGWISSGLVGLQLPFLTHSRSTADDEDHDDEKRGDYNDDQHVLLQEVHHSGQDKVLQADHGGGDGVLQGGGYSRCVDVDRFPCREGDWEK